jgi:hypothetical protein
MMSNDALTTAAGEPADILLLTAPDCHFCEDGKQVLARLAGEFPLGVREVAWSSPEGQELAARHGALFPPGLLLDGRFIGFGRISERRLRRLLEQRGAARARS